MAKKYWDTICLRLRQASGRVQMKHLCIAAGVVFVLGLIPILLLAPYSFPTMDDYVFAEDTHRVYSEAGSLWQTIEEAVRTSRGFYETWQGTFTAIALFALQPGVFGMYAATPWIMLASLCGGTFMLVWVVCRRLLRADGWASGLVALVLLFLCVQQVPDGNQALYWYNSAVFYVFFHGLSLVLYSLVLLYCTTESRRRFVYLALSCLLALFVSGGNYVTGLVSLLCMACAVLVLLLLKRRAWLGVCLPTALFAVGFAINMAAPGNAVRAAQQLESLGLVRSVYEAFKGTYVYLNEWAYLLVGLGLLLLAPVLWQLVGRVRFAFPLPVLVTAGSVCLLAAAMFPHIYATAYYGPERLLNIIFFWFLLLAVGNLAWWLGWLRHKLVGWKRAAGTDLAGAIGGWMRAHTLQIVAFATLAFGVMLVFPGRLNKPLTTVQAAQTLRSGEAAEFAAGMRTRIALAEAAEVGSGLVVPAITARPELLTFDTGMLTDDAEYWTNVRFARYYGLAWVAEESVPESTE